VFGMVSSAVSSTGGPIPRHFFGGGVAAGQKPGARCAVIGQEWIIHDMDVYPQPVAYSPMYAKRARLPLAHFHHRNSRARRHCVMLGAWGRQRPRWTASRFCCSWRAIISGLEWVSILGGVLGHIITICRLAESGAASRCGGFVRVEILHTTASRTEADDFGGLIVWF
jgi:hypothetical protein